MAIDDQAHARAIVERSPRSGKGREMMTPDRVTKLVEDLEYIVHNKPVCDSADVLNALRAEHRRVIRKVQAMKKANHKYVDDCDLSSWDKGFDHACDELLAWLKGGK